MYHNIFISDVQALAVALSELGSHTGRARTAFWCALQMASRDLPLECMKIADSINWVAELPEGFNNWVATSCSTTDEDYSFDTVDRAFGIVCAT